MVTVARQTNNHTNDNETKYKKWATNKAPAKSDHKHSYVSPWAWITCKDGKDYRFVFKARCIDCGYCPRRVKDRDKVVEIEVSPNEYMEIDRELRKARNNK